MNWYEAEAAIKSYIEETWAGSSYASMPLVWENDPEEFSTSYMVVDIEGTYSDKTIYGSVGKRSSIEAGIIFLHVFVPTGEGKEAATKPIVYLSSVLELRTIASYIDLDGANPPTPIHFGIDELDREIPLKQPGGNYYRCSGSVPFIIRSVR